MFYGSLLLLNGKMYVIMRSAMSHMCNNCTTFHGIQSLSSSLTFIQTCPRVKNLMTTIKIHIVYGRSSQNVFIGKFLSQNRNKQTSIDQTKMSFINARNINQKWTLHQNLEILRNEYEYTKIRCTVNYFLRLKGKIIVNRKCYLV